jgi:protein-disulfide isomerase
VLATPFGVPMPAFGLAGFVVLAALAFASGPRVRAFHRAAAIGGAVVGAGLIAVQLLLGQLCPYCMAIDLSACAAAGVAIWRVKGGWDLDGASSVRAGLGALTALVPAGILGLGLTAKVHLPDVIAEEMGRAPRGQATVVEFVDFECPFCRDEWDDLAPMLAAAKDRVRVVRKLVPLTRIHPHAMDAARAACCGDLLGQGDAMADALFHAPVEELTAEGCQRIAVALGIDPASYGACVSDPKTAERIALDRRVFDRAAAKTDGLPLLWIGERKIMGVRQASELQRALDEAITKAGS